MIGGLRPAGPAFAPRHDPSLDYGSLCRRVVGNAARQAAVASRRARGWSGVAWAACSPLEWIRSYYPRVVLTLAPDRRPSGDTASP